MKFVRRGILILLCSFCLWSNHVHAEERADWSIYIYMCGSDLESSFAAATLNLKQILGVQLPEGVQIIIEAGGTKKWCNDFFSPDHIERYIYDCNGFRRIAQLEQANMGDISTFHDFLEFCDNEYPADKDALIIWNHGGGIQNGVCFDENYNMDGLSGNELKEELHGEDKSELYDLLGFDACLMGSLESGLILKNCAEYMVASEDTETGFGWAYDSWLTELSLDPSMDAVQLAEIICNSYMEFNTRMGVGDRATMSVMNLTQYEQLQEEYEALGWKMLRKQLEDQSFFIDLKRYASTLFRFGASGEEKSIENVDILALMHPFLESLGEEGSNFFNSMLNSCVYNVCGDYSAGKSVSVYFPLDGNPETVNAYEDMECSRSMAEFFHYCLTGELSENARSYLGIQDDSGEKKEKKTLIDIVPEGFELTQEGNMAVVNLSPEARDHVTDVSYAGMYYDENRDCGIFLGTDDELECNWETGEIRAELMNWGIEFGGHLGFLGLMYQNEDYNLYDVPIMLNDEPYYMHLVWKEAEQRFEILGVQKKQIDVNIAERTGIQLQSGDRIRMITKELKFSEDTSGDTSGDVLSDEFIYEEGMQIEVREMTGVFGMTIVLDGLYGESVWSDLLAFES